MASGEKHWLTDTTKQKKTQMFSFPAAKFKIHFSTNTDLVATVILPCVWFRSRAVNKANLSPPLMKLNI